MAGSDGAALEDEEELVSLLPDAEPLAAGALLEPLAGGVLVEPLAELGGVAVLELELAEPEGAGAVLSRLDVSTVAEPEVELELDGLVGLVGALVEPADDDELPGAREPSRSQPASKLAPSASDTATAKVESLIVPPWLG